jgi:hypothetical protein
MGARLIFPLLTLAACFSIAGCGSKVSRANYYRVQYGMSEEEVEDLLGPAHAESVVSVTETATTAPAVGKVKSWSRDGLVIRVTFHHGAVTSRSAEGIAAESPGFLTPSRPPSAT